MARGIGGGRAVVNALPCAAAAKEKAALKAAFRIDGRFAQMTGLQGTMLSR